MRLGRGFFFVGGRESAGFECYKVLGVLFGCFSRKIDGHRCPFWLFCWKKRWVSIPGLPVGLIMYQGNPSISPERTPLGTRFL